MHQTMVNILLICILNPQIAPKVYASYQDHHMLNVSFLNILHRGWLFTRHQSTETRVHKLVTNVINSIHKQHKYADF